MGDYLLQDNDGTAASKCQTLLSNCQTEQGVDVCVPTIVYNSKRHVWNSWKSVLLNLKIIWSTFRLNLLLRKRIGVIERNTNWQTGSKERLNQICIKVSSYIGCCSFYVGTSIISTSVSALCFCSPTLRRRWNETRSCTWHIKCFIKVGL